MANENKTQEEKPLRAAALLSVRVAWTVGDLDAEKARELLNAALSDFEFQENLKNVGITMDEFEIASEGHDPAEFGLE